MAEVIVVGADGSEAGARAAHFAAEHVQDDGLVVVAYVVPWSPYTKQSAEENARRSATKQRETEDAQSGIIDPLLAELHDKGYRAEGLVRHGQSAEVLCDIATERNASHIVVGRRGQSRVRSMLFGSTPGSLIQIATTPVTVVP